MTDKDPSTRDQDGRLVVSCYSSQVTPEMRAATMYGYQVTPMGRQALAATVAAADASSARLARLAA
ncbi:hypothetical protein ACFL5O_09360 [Myxococcota bacterium]